MIKIKLDRTGHDWLSNRSHLYDFYYMHKRLRDRHISTDTPLIPPHASLNYHMEQNLLPNPTVVVFLF